MLEVNRVWLGQANPGLLKSYKEQKNQGPSKEWGPPQVLKMTHQDKNPNLHDGYISPEYYQRQREIFREIENEESKGEKRFLIMGGTDGGHLLNETLRGSRVKHLVVIESSMESFYHSLKITDWPSLFNDFNERGGTIYFHIGPVTLEIKQRIAQHLNEIGPFNSATIHFCHDNSRVGMEAVSSVVRCLQDVINSLGFYDDERVGLAHSLHKLDNGERFLWETRKPWIEKPVVVCGSGPSLLKSIPQLLKHREDVFVASCGSAIGMLFKYDIKPDFHIEQERPKVSSNWTKLTTTPEYRDGVTLIGLNVVHPQSNGLFKDRAYALKQNDFGAIVLKSQLGEPPQLYFVNPLAANAGVSIMTSLGFRHIYMAGVDCAFGDDGSTHAKGHSGNKPTQGAVEVKGNFRAKVRTSPTYNDSRITLGNLIRLSPDVKYYNLSDGAYIEGARPTKKIRVGNPKPVTKEEIMAPFRSKPVELDRTEMVRSFTSSMFGLRNVVDSIPEKIKGKDEAFFYMDSVYSHLHKIKTGTPLFWYLVKGTITTQLVFLSACADVSLEHFDRASAVFKELVGLMFEQVKTDLFKFDIWESNGGLPEDVNRSSR